MRNALLGLLLLVAFAGALLLASRRRAAPGPPAAGEGTDRGIPVERLDEVLREANRGIAHLDRHEFSKSVEAWRKVVALAPEWPTGWVNLGIALLNTQEKEETERIFRRAIALDPKNPWAHYSLSRLFGWLVRPEEEIAELREVVRIDPEDADTHYALGMALRQKAGGADVPSAERERLEEEARRELERAVALNPSHTSAWYALFQARQRSPERDRAMEALERYQALRQSGTGDERSATYTQMGRYADVVRLFDLPPVAEPPVSVDLAEADPTALPLAPQGGTAGPLRIDGTYRDRADFLERGASRFGSGCVLADLDGDGDLDAALAVCGREGGIRLYRNNGKGDLTGVTGESSVGPSFPAMGIYAGDLDNDGDLDLFATGAGARRLLRNRGNGTFEDGTEASGLAAGGTWSLGASLVDVDQDGDLDLFVAGYADLSSLGGAPVDADALPAAPEALFVNRGDATFEEEAAKVGVDGGATRTLSVLAADVDGDGDPDLLALNDGAPNRLYRNDRVLRFREETPPLLAGAGRRATGALAWDPDGNGTLDLLLLHGLESPVEALRNLGRARLEPDPVLSKALGRATAIGGATLDVDNDGDADLLLAGTGQGGGLLLFRNDEGAGFFDATQAAGLKRLAPRDRRGLSVGDLDGDGGLDILVANAGALPTLLRNDGAAVNRWIGIRPRGVRSGKDLRSPAQGIGAAVEVKAGPLVGERVLGGGSGYLGADSDLVHFGLGKREGADYVRILWPDGVVQAELDLPGAQVHRIEELQRKGSSCPVLFAWDGERFACVTDFLGVGGLGFLVAPGVYGPPDRDEVVPIPFALVPREGRFELRIAEPLEEVTYADALSLLAWDHPSDVEVLPDERFAASPPLPSGEPLAIRDRVHPLRARGEGGEDLLGAVLRADRTYAGPKALEPRFLGYAKPHALELDFGERALSLADGGGRAFLFAWGWVEYPYSRINLGASQAGLRMEAPSIEVPDGKGGWRTALPEFGYPAGLPRWMAIEVTSILREGHARIRLRTNVEVYWDEIFLARVGAAEVRTTAIAPDSADLRACGYPREFSPDGKAPRLYDYGILDRGFPFFRSLPGHYTRHGDVRELLASSDDRFAIFGRGEEIALRFDPAALPPLREGWTRAFALRAEGYCKDMDPCTGGGDAVEPLPFRAMSSYPYGPDERYPDDPAHAAYRAVWNTRRVGAPPRTTAPAGDR
ncbi:MAG TPA: FG-GAP-like repeat-containing protein [Planctomycetota bacterium]|nr:FG-GAP-like repeat-containing protein [Planctomycetota bacterium]